MKKSILIVVPSIHPSLSGGTGKRAQELSKALHENGHSVSLVSTKLNAELTPTLPYKLYHYTCVIERYFIPKMAIKDLVQLIRSNDSIILISNWTFLNLMFSIIGFCCRKPIYFNPSGALKIYGRNKIFKFIYKYSVELFVNFICKGFVSITTEEINDVPTILRKKVQAKQFVIPNGITLTETNHEQNNFNKIKKSLNKGNYILFLGRLNSIKGPDLLLDAFLNISNLYPDLNLVFAGPDEGLKNHLQNKINQHKNHKKLIHFTGYVNGNEKEKLLKNCLFLAIPSRFEAMSIVALEAAKYGKFVLLTKNCNFSQLVNFGCIECDANVTSLKNALIHMLKKLTKENSFNNQLKQFIIQNYSWNSISLKFEEMFQKAK